jgi:hypothetical protein
MFYISQPNIRRDGSQGQIFQTSRTYRTYRTSQIYQIYHISGLIPNRISTVRFGQPKRLFFSLEAIIAPKYGDTSATYWKLYGSEAEINDENLVDSLKGNTGSMVFLVSGDTHRRLQVHIAVSMSHTIALQNTLFSAIVASFIIEIYKTLLPSNGQNTADGPPSNAVRINIVLFISFFLSMMSAVGCALIQQWCDDYKKFAYPRAAPHTRGRVRTYLFRGLKVFQMRRFMYGIHVLLHISVFLFFWALSDFFYTVNHESALSPVTPSLDRWQFMCSSASPP